MSVKVKILAGFVVVALIGAALGFTGISTINKLTTMSEELLRLDVESKDFTNILTAHYDWRGNMNNYIIVKDEFKGSVDPTGCILGKWLTANKDLELHPEVRALLDELIPSHNTIHLGAADVVALIEAGKEKDAIDLYLTTILPNANSVIAKLKEISILYGTFISEQNDEIITEGDKAIKTITFVIVIAVIIALIFGFVISLMITRPLAILSKFMVKASTTGDLSLSDQDKQNIAKYAKSKDEIGVTIKSSSDFVEHVIDIATELEIVASGDLTAHIETLSANDVMGNSLKTVVENLNHMFSEILETSTEVEKDALRVQTNTQSINDSMSHIASAAQELAEGSTQQALSVQELSEAVHVIADNTKSNTELAGKASTLAKSVIANAQKGSQQMKDMIAAVSDITEASRKIETIIETINDIASQTNLLSLNASIEAARAGEHGRGFAVVASEVGKLAEESTASAAKTNLIIQASIEKAELGAQIVEETAKSLAEIIAGVEESSKFIHEIAEASEGQLSGIQNINTSIESVSDVIQQNSATAEESAAASEECAAAAMESITAVEELTNISTILHNLVARFKIH